VAEALFGDYSPGGKLPMTIPRSVGHVPAYYNYKPSARRGYLFDSADPLFAFGFGLSYTTFAVDNLRLTKARIRPGNQPSCSSTSKTPDLVAATRSFRCTSVTWSAR